DGLIRPYSGRPVNGIGPASVKLGILLGASDEEGRGLGESVKPPKIHVAAIQQVEGAWFEQKFVEQIDIMDLAAGHVNIGWNATAKIQQSVHFYGTLAAAKSRPGKKS